METGVGKLVRCLETDRVGLVVDSRTVSYAVVYRVKWGCGDQNWVDVNDIEIVR